MHKIVRVEAKSNYVLKLIFENGTEGEISIADRLFGPMFEPLKNPELFTQVKIDKFGAICWPNEADLAPDALYQKVKYLGTKQNPSRTDSSPNSTHISQS